MYPSRSSRGMVKDLPEAACYRLPPGGAARERFRERFGERLRLGKGGCSFPPTLRLAAQACQTTLMK